MATSNKVQDPAAAALSAIEEALNLAMAGGVLGESPKEPELSTPIFPKASDPDKTPKLMRRQSEAAVDEAPEPRGLGADDAERLAPRLPEVDDHPLFSPKRPERRAERRPPGDAASLPPLTGEHGEQLAPSVMPANDDRHSVGPILRALNKRPSRVPQVLAIGFSSLWLLLAAVYFYADWGNIAGQGGLFSRPVTALYVMLAVGPVLFFIISAMLIRRAQEMRLTVRSMAEIAMRLAEPETIATEQMVTLSQAVRREIVSMGDGIERALARAGELETLVRSEVSNLERSYSENERRIKALVDSLSSERENMLSNAERMRNAIASVQEFFAQDIDVASARLAEGLGEAANRVTTSLGAKSEEIRFALGRTGEEVVANLLLHGEDMIGRLEQTQESVSFSLTETGETITQGLAERVGEIDAHLRSAGETLIASVVERLDDSGGRIATTLDDAGGRIAATLGQASDRVATTLSETLSTLSVQSDQMNERLALTAQEALSVLVTHVETMQENVGTAAQQALDAFAYHSTALNDRFAETIGDAVTAIATHGDRVNETIADRIARFEDTVVGQGSLVAEKVGTAAQQALDTFAYHSTALSDRFAETIGDAVTAIATHGDRVNETIADRIARFEDTVVGQGSLVAEKVANETEQMAAMLADRIARFEDTVVGQGSLVAGKVANETEQMAAMLAGHFEAMEATLSQRGSELEACAQRTTEVLETQIRTFEERAAAKTYEVGQSLEGLLTRIDSGLDERAKALNETLAARTVEIARELGDGGREVAQVIEAKIGEIEQLIANRSTSLTDTLSTKAAELNLALGGRALEIAETFSTRADEVSQVLGARALEIADTLDDRISRFEEQVVGRLDTISSDLDSRGHNVAETLIACATEINSTLRQHAATITQVLDHELGQLAAVLTGRVDALKELLGQATDDLDTTLAGRTGEIGSVLAARVNEIGGVLANRLFEVQTVLELGAEMLEGRSATIVEQIGHKQRELTAALDESSANLRTAIESGAEASVSALVETNERLGTDITATLGQIDERNVALQEMIANAGASFTAVETVLSAGVQEFQLAIANITREIQDVGANADTTIASARALYENVTHQQQSFAFAAGELARSQAELDRSLDERRSSLEALLTSVQTRREDFDEMMRAFSRAIDQSFERVEGRAREIGTFLAEASQATTGLVEQQFSEIRTAMSNERAHTASLLRAAYEQANAEIDTIFAQSTERFQSAAVEMRGLARDIQRELETTREELHRNAVSLPQETAEQAAVMRRVVADQIKALNELTDVVARSGRAYDLSEPLTSASGRVVEAGPPVRRIEPLRQDQMRFAETSAASVEPSRPEPLRPRPVAPAPRPSAPSPAPERGGAGWLSDLLARASRDDATQSARPSAVPGSRGAQQTGPLETISHDIARMVDHAAVADAWDRYRRGDANAFTRQLYIGRGPQTFDDIRRRYKSDPDFRDTVDRYVQEFERLLADINRDDRDDSLTRTYLTSETGKVYTMLAHAAGRLG